VNDDIYGLDMNEPQIQENWRILYFEEDQLASHKTDFGFLHGTMEADTLPLPHLMHYLLN